MDVGTRVSTMCVRLSEEMSKTGGKLGLGKMRQRSRVVTCSRPHPVCGDLGKVTNLSRPQIPSTTGVMTVPILPFCGEDGEIIHGRHFAWCLALANHYICTIRVENVLSLLDKLPDFCVLSTLPPLFRVLQPLSCQVQLILSL